MTTPIDPIREALPVAAYLVTGLANGEPSICFEGERGDYGDEDHTPVFEPLCKVSDAEAEIEALKADAARYRWLRIEGACEQVCNGTWKDLKHAGDLDAAIDAALKEPS